MANEIFLEGSVGSSWWDEPSFTPTDVRAMLDGRSGPLTVHLNSGGGVATDGQAIYAMLCAYPGTVTVVISGIAASAASLIAMAGDKIVMTEGSLLMIHDPAQFFTDGRGTEADHIKAAETLAVLSTAYAGIYAKRAQCSLDEARSIMKAETFYDPQGAINAGFADEIMEFPTKAVATFDYRIYANAPAALRDRAAGMGSVPTRAAVMAMFAGQSRVPFKMEMPMKDDQTAPTPADNLEVTGSDISAADHAAVPGEAAPVAKPNATMSERARVRRLMAMTETAGLSMALATEHIEKGTSEAAFLDIVLAQKVEKDVNHMNIAPAARVTMDAREKFIAGATLALQAKTMIAGGERNEFTSMSLSELARHSLTMNGITKPFSDKRDMVGAAFTMDAGAMTTGDFASVLANVMNKAALVGWEEAAETFELWTRKGTLADFKATKRVGVGVFGSLPQVIEGANYTYGTVNDRGEAIALATYGKLLRISRQSIINDDLSVLGDLPRRMGRAAKRTIGNLVYAVLTGNPTMSDGVALFHSTHGNLAGTTGAPSVTTLGAGKAAMRVQADAGSALNIEPRFLLVPAALEMTAKQVIGSAVDPTATKGMAMNPVNNMAEVIVDARLDAASATAWFMAADPAAYDTIEVAYLDGNDMPYLEQQTQWTSDGVEMKVRIDAGVAPLDYRTLYKNAG